jgi:hypothetical protein
LRTWWRWWWLRKESDWWLFVPLMHEREQGKGREEGTTDLELLGGICGG